MNEKDFGIFELYFFLTFHQIFIGLREENCLVVNAGAVLTSDFGKLRDASCDCEEQFYVCQRDIGELNRP